ncbi:H/ACA snoRNP pseudouridylase subunit [Clonorchis sinensis]|nr:H/ACA snoRNP pseudouridylase subunit [Clonorchis sinensis]
MICVSWLFPAGLFTPVIMGWKQITSEPPRAEGKCDVSFTYYPIFNTTLIIGYFWTTLIVMCSLYVGIYQVARRLERKSQGTSEKLAALFKSFGAELTGAENQNEDNTEHATQPSKIGIASSAGINDSGFKESPEDIFNTSGDLQCMELNRTDPTVNTMNAATPSEVNFDNDSMDPGNVGIAKKVLSAIKTTWSQANSPDYNDIKHSDCAKITVHLIMRRIMSSLITLSFIAPVTHSKILSLQKPGQIGSLIRHRMSKSSSGHTRFSRYCDS